MILTVRYAWALVAVVAALCLTGAPVHAEAAAGFDGVPAEIPVGLASDDEETSRGISAVLERCAAAYQATQTFHADGKYISIEKTDGETTHVTAQIKLDFIRPKKMAVRWISQAPTIRSDFVSDGKRVSMSWAEEAKKTTSRKFYQIPAPDTVEAFTALRRKGELYEDRSNSLPPMVFVPELLTFSRPQEVFRGERKYTFAYEGLETLDGSDCHRINVKQEESYYTHIVWIDAKTFFIRKTSAVGNYDDTYNPVDSFEEAVNAYMRIVEYDNISTAARSVKKDAFAWKPPAGYRRDTAREIADADDAGSSSLWDSLVAAAAQSDASKTSWSLKQEAGDRTLTLSELAQLETKPLELIGTRLPGEKAGVLLVAFKDGTVSVRDYAGQEKRRVQLGQEISRFDCLETTMGETIQFLATDKGQERLTAYSLEGKALWHYEHPETTIGYFLGAGKEPFVYLGLDGGWGLRKLNEQGEIVQARSGGGYISSISVSAPGQNRVAVSRGYSTDFFDKDLRRVKGEFEDRLVSFIWEGNPADPDLLTMVRTADRSLLVQRRNDAAEVKWTTTLGANLENATSGGIMSFKLKGYTPAESGEPRLLFAGASTGILMLVDKSDGSAIWRGELTADAATVERNDKRVIGGIARGDLNGDGAEEVYVRLDKHILRLE